MAAGAGLIRPFLWSVALFPITVLLHELAHWLVARASGFPARLHFASVDNFPEQLPFGGAPGLVALTTLAGPAMTIALMIAGMAARSKPWGLPLVATALSRFVINAMFIVQQALVLAGIAQASQPNFDEVVAARALSAPAPLFAGVGALAFFVGGVWLWRNAGPWQFLALILGTLTGMVGWLGLVGPMLLP